MAPQQTRHGIAVIGGILLRPTLIVFGFVFSFLLMIVGGQFMGLVFSVVFNNVANNGTIGPVAFVTLLGILVVTATSLVYFIARLITHLAEHAPMWIGGNAGANLGVDQAVSSAAQQGGGKGTAGAAAEAPVGYGVQAATGAAKGGSDAVKENRAAREKRRHAGRVAGEER